MFKFILKKLEQNRAKAEALDTISEKMDAIKSNGGSEKIVNYILQIAHANDSQITRQLLAGTYRPGSIQIDPVTLKIASIDVIMILKNQSISGPIDEILKQRISNAKETFMISCLMMTDQEIADLEEEIGRSAVSDSSKNKSFAMDEYIEEKKRIHADQKFTEALNVLKKYDQADSNDYAGI